ncbi:hydrolase, alpha/beta fold family protein [Oceaniovalibus guishaninsula JLT2003]|uniref:Hydrolase, alpha/beta fold family protein n=1 Tax=Oceaniovalibus guishaninsula JLT2003 TaxID=1231392 RepID=K2HSV5_9RHOB|nr:alpha/beta fold hydrolase [Oceaniovalibus guishaninsula]EKE45704.1 hydrolase, alpha/beta fold family protein [Oceaniovalibus guishaninsula JLT2003]
MIDLARTAHDSDGTAPPLLIAHGLFGSARNWGVIARRLSDRGPVVAVDMRNHGRSDWSDDHSYAAMAGDLARVAADMGAPVDVLGHSMGGKAAMMLALRLPDLVRRLVVADIAPVAYDHSKIHLIDAMQGLDLSKIETRRDADEQLRITVDSDDVRAFLLQSLDVADRCWHLNLDVLRNAMERITGWPDPEGRFDGPVLFLSGADSDYVGDAHRPAIDALFSKARFARLAGAGHWLHAQKPREFEAAVRAFLDG